MENIDRHKSKRNYHSGAQKRKLAQEKNRKCAEVIAKTQRMTDFLITASTSASNSQSESSPGKRNSEEILVECENRELHQTASHTLTFDKTQSEEETNKENFEENLELDSTCFDIGLWPESVKNVEYCIRMGTSKLQHCDELTLKRYSFKQKLPGDTGTGTRQCVTNMFKRKGPNGDIIHRSWLCFSPSTGRVYCFVCKLLSTVRNHFSHSGFYDWKHASSRLMDHEISKAHLNAVVAVACRAKELGRVDTELAKQAEEIENYWKMVLQRLISVIKFICERGLALRGENELLGSPNNGNYLGILELLAEYDEFLKHHINNNSNPGSGRTNYLSSTICEEILHLMGQSVLKEIVVRIKKSKYYSVSLDSTPDEGHTDQLTVVFRYMECFTPVERFLIFLPNQGHKAEDIFNSLMIFLQEHDIDLKNCRGQSYDNASVMSGKYNGVQAKIVERNKLALWIPCAAHSLNLVAKAAAECCPAAIAFFDFLEELYVFFISSTYRYNLLTECLKSASSNDSDSRQNIIVPKRINTTRWSSRSDASKALLKGYNEIKETLSTISDDCEQQLKTRSDANSLYNRMCLLETGIFSIFWNEILERTNSTNHILQDPNIDLNSGVAALRSLKEFIRSRRDNFEIYESRGMKLSGTKDYSTHRKRQRNIRLTPLDYGKTPETEMTPQEKFKTQNVIPIIDQFIVSLNQRLSAYESIHSNFGFLHHLENLTPHEIEAHSQELVKIYNNDLDENLGVELVQFVEFFKTFKEEIGLSNASKELQMYRILKEKNVDDAFPNVEVTLRLYLVLMLTNCSGERSFSKLKLIKNRLRSTMGQQRLNNLSIMSIEHDILKELDMSDIIKEFALKKSRKVPGLF